VRLPLLLPLLLYLLTLLVGVGCLSLVLLRVPQGMHYWC
jgi:hypothetical protein